MTRPAPASGRWRQSLLVLAVVLFGAVRSVLAQPVPDAVTESIRDELRGKVALDHIHQIATHHRSVGSHGYHEAAVYIAKAARAAGLSDVQILTFGQDGGKTRVLDTYQTGYAWEITGAELGIADGGVRLCRYEDVPTCAAENSASIDTTADVVDVGRGLSEGDYSGKDVAGKLVLAAGQASAVLAFARSRNILGVVSYWENFEPDRSAFPDQVPWQAVAAEPKGQLVAFSISARAAADLKRRLARGPVRLRARIESRLFEGEAEIVSGVIPGTTKAREEVLFTAHLNHHRPGANDNASGCGLNLEIAAVLTRLIADGRIPRPARTIRFLWLPEHRGPQLYLDRYRDYGARGVAVINNDMVGENQQQCNSTFVVVRTPDSLPSYLNDLIEALTEDVAQSQFRSPFGSENLFHYRVAPYSGGISDHYYFVDGSISVPALLLNFAPDNFYHSNEDTADHVDATSLMRVGYIGAVTAVYLATAGVEEGRRLAGLTASGGLARLAREFGEAIAALASGTDLHSVYRDRRNRLIQAGQREQAAVRSVARLDEALTHDPAVEQLTAHVGTTAKADVSYLDKAYRDLCTARTLDPQSPTAASTPNVLRVPVRTLYGPLRLAYLLERLTSDRRAWYASAPLSTLAREEVLNFMDGRRDLQGIIDAVSGEYGPVDGAAVERFVDDLVSVGLVKWRN
jgi:aminopeptidase YwaD